MDDNKLIPIKITILRGDPRKGETPMKYPTGHNPKVIDQLGIGMHYGKTKQLGKGDSEEYAVAMVPLWYLRELYRDMAKAGEDKSLVQVLDEDEAEQFFVDNIPEQEEVILDRKAIEVIEKKVALGLTLTAEQQKMIDPDDDTPGLNKNPRKGFKKKVAGMDKITKGQATVLKNKVANGEEL